MSLWDSYGLHQYDLGSGLFSEDARGRWYLNITVKVARHRVPDQAAVRQACCMDLGLHDFVTVSDGHKEPAERFYRDLEPALAVAQRAGHKQRVRAIHAKIANRRKDTLHQLSTRLVRPWLVKPVPAAATLSAFSR